jgi:hypothetical protein
MRPSASHPESDHPARLSAAEACPRGRRAGSGKNGAKFQDFLTGTKIPSVGGDVAAYIFNEITHSSSTHFELMLKSKLQF